MKLILLLILLYCSSITSSISSYFISKFGNLSKSPLSPENGRECLHTTRQSIPITNEITVCYRQKPYTLRRTSGIISFGKIDPEWKDFEHGFVFSVWYSGAWLAYKEKGKDMSWINMGSHFIEIHAWRHTCITLNFLSGKYSNTENGILRFEDTYEKLVEIGKNLNNTLNHVTLGCWYIPYEQGNEMYGEYTDFQMFGRTLTGRELNEITGCNERKEGDIISWGTEDWHMNGTEKTSKQEILDFEGDVCRKQNSSFLLMQFKQAGLPHGLSDTCAKLTGKVLR